MPMINQTQQTNSSWPFIQKIAFRFFFLYFMFQIAPWTWLDKIPGLSSVINYSYVLFDRIVDFFNDHWFHFPKTSIVNNGSGDTSRDWEQLFTFLSLSVIISLLWGILDRNRKSYRQAAYWLRTFVRYFIIINCFLYGIIKLYALQMAPPLQSQLATPLGDLLPMRFSWLFIGYSTPYEIFSGAMEVLAGLLLLNRRTITLGLFVATAVFINVMMLNLCYDIPVKINSMHLVLYCVFLLVTDGNRLFYFFVLNKPVGANATYQISFPKKWMRISRIVLKLAFIVLYVIMTFFSTKDRYRTEQLKTETKPFREGVYDVTVFAVNKDTIPALIADTLRWRDLIFEKGGFASAGTTDTTFRMRYRRGYFNFVTDSTQKTISFKKFPQDSNFIFSFHYALPDSNTILLRGKQKNDSLYVVLKRSNRHFQLAEKQFHWISEANR